VALNPPPSCTEVKERVELTSTPPLFLHGMLQSEVLTVIAIHMELLQVCLCGGSICVEKCMYI